MSLLWKTATSQTCDACDSAADDAGVENHGFAKWHDDMSHADRAKEKAYLLEQGYAGCSEHPAH